MQTTFGRTLIAFSILTGATLTMLIFSTTRIRYQDSNTFAIESAIEAVVQIGIVPRGGSSIVTVGGGVIVSEKGYVLTVKHNLTQAENLFIKTVRGDVLRVMYYVADAHRDLAILVVSKGDAILPVARVGNSRTLRVGQTVYAIGHPSPSAILDDAPSVSRGIVSAINRVVIAPRASDEKVEDAELSSWRVEYTDVLAASDLTQIPLSPLIQTDAMVNSGSSGGALVDEYGSIVGVVQAMVSKTGSNVGMNFAIPIAEAELLLRSIEVEEE